MRRRQYRKVWLRRRARYEKRGLAIFRRKLREAVNRISFDSLTESTFRISVSFNISLESVQDAYVELYNEVGLMHGKRVGAEINKEIRNTKSLRIKEFNAEEFEGTHREFIRQWLIQNAGTRILGVREELVNHITNFIANRIDGQTDIRQITRELQTYIKSRSFYRWEIMRIVRTETTAAANASAVRAGETSRIEMEKEWISSNNARTRRIPEDAFDHIIVDGQRVGLGQKFDVQGDMLDYPGDPKGQAANVINCRCTVAMVPKRDRNGRLVFAA